MVQKKNELLILASQDGMCILSYPKIVGSYLVRSYVNTNITASFQERMMLAKLDIFVTEMRASLKRKVDHGTVEVVSTIEYKHKSSIATVIMLQDLLRKKWD